MCCHRSCFASGRCSQWHNGSNHGLNGWSHPLQTLNFKHSLITKNPRFSSGGHQKIIMIWCFDAIGLLKREATFKLASLGDKTPRCRDLWGRLCPPRCLAEGGRWLRSHFFQPPKAWLGATAINESYVPQHLWTDNLMLSAWNTQKSTSDKPVP